MAAHAVRKTHCARGHPFGDFIHVDGMRRCLVCLRNSQRLWVANKRRKARMKPEEDDFGEGECICRRTGLGGNDPDAGWRLDRWCPVHGEDVDAAYERERDDR